VVHVLLVPEPGVRERDLRRGLDPGVLELYARSAEEATEVLEEAARGTLAIMSLAEESRPPASTGGDQH
jgi:hypothetical protein